MHTFSSWHIIHGDTEAEERSSGDNAAAEVELSSIQHEEGWAESKTIAENRRGYNIELELTLRGLACASRELVGWSSIHLVSNVGPSCSSTRRYMPLRIRDLGVPARPAESGRARPGCAGESRDLARRILTKLQEALTLGLMLRQDS